MESNLLIDSLQIISKTSLEQKSYIRSLFKNQNYDNLEEILLSYEDAKYLIDIDLRYFHYKEKFDELNKILDEIDDNELYFFSSLDDPIWNKARKKANEILYILESQI